MLTQGRFLISYQVFDNIPVNNNGQTHVREILKDTQAFTINYRTEQIRNYFLIPIPFILMTMLVDSLLMTLPTTSRLKSR